jgi:hypothetical protein
VKGPLSIINTDNVPSNGAKISALLRDEALLDEVLRGGSHNDKQGASSGLVVVSCLRACLFEVQVYVSDVITALLLLLLLQRC